MINLSYIPPNSYYVYVNMKLGTGYQLSPVPPKHLLSLSFTRESEEVTNNVEISLFDDTALRVEYELFHGKGDSALSIEFDYGYVGGPHSPVYKLKILDWSSQMNNAGQMTLNLKCCSEGPSNSVNQPKSKTYDNMTIEDILKDIANEEGWRLVPGSIEPIAPVYEPDPNVSGVSSPNNTGGRRLKTFVRSNQPAPQFIQQVLAPECRSASNGASGYRLWFSDTRNGEDVAEITESTTSGSGGSALKAITDVFKTIGGLLSGLFNIGSEVNAAEQLNDSSVLVRTANDSSAIFDKIMGAVSGGSVSSGVKQTSSIMYFRSSSSATSSIASKSYANTKDLALRGEILKGIDPNYIFEWGTGDDKASSVISLSYTHSEIAKTSGDEIQGAALDKVRNTLIKFRYDRSTNPFNAMFDTGIAPSSGGQVIDASTMTLEDLQNMAAYNWYKCHKLSHKVTLEIFGDPTIQRQKSCSLLVLTHYGQPHHTTGIYNILSVKDEISGGSFKTTLELSRDGTGIQMDASGSNLDVTTSINGKKGNTKVDIDQRPKPPSINAADANVQKAMKEGQSIANDDTHLYSNNPNDRDGPNYDSISFIYHTLDEAGFKVLNSNGKAGTSLTIRKDLEKAGFDCINYESPDKLKPGDILVDESSGRAVYYVGNNQVLGAHSSMHANDDQISIKEMNANSSWTKVYRYN